MFEVEVKVRVKNFSEIENKLKKIEASNIGVKDQRDIVFLNKKYLDNDGKVIEGGLVGRIRTVNGVSVLELKEIKRVDGGVELKHNISDVEAAIEFLKKLDFYESFNVTKNRTKFSYKDFIICLDSVKDLGYFIEIEKIVDYEAQKRQARDEIMLLLDELSIEYEIEPQKYGDLIIEKNNNK